VYCGVTECGGAGAILHNVDYMTVCRVRVLGKAYNSALCKIALGWLFCGAFFGVCRVQLFGFCGGRGVG